MTIAYKGNPPSQQFLDGLERLVEVEQMERPVNSVVESVDNVTGNDHEENQRTISEDPQGTLVQSNNINMYSFVTHSGRLYTSHPVGYKYQPVYPFYRGLEHCPHCLLAPCVIQMPPDWLRGQCSPHPANENKRHRLYRLFWRLLNHLGVWADPEYLQRKERRTDRNDKREIQPHCVVTVITEMNK